MLVKDKFYIFLNFLCIKIWVNDFCFCHTKSPKLLDLVVESIKISPNKVMGLIYQYDLSFIRSWFGVDASFGEYVDIIITPLGFVNTWLNPQTFHKILTGSLSSLNLGIHFRQYWIRNKTVKPFNRAFGEVFSLQNNLACRLASAFYHIL